MDNSQCAQWRLTDKMQKLHFSEQHIVLAPPPTIINEKEEYEVEEVQKHRKWGWRTQLLVYWKDYSDEHD